MRRLSFESARCLACRSCEIACALVHSQSGSLEMALAETPVPRRRVAITGDADGVAALRCEQCDEPLCVFACKSGALARDPLTGLVALDEERCLGCAMCLMVCPFGLRLDPARDRVVRCDACAGRDVPACVTACPTHALGVREDAPAARGTSDFTGRLVVVGSSAAGIAACEAARESAPGCLITLLTADAVPQYSRPLLTYALAGRIERGALDWRAAEYLEEALGVEVLRGARATGLRPDTRAVVLADGREIRYDALVIATGARAKALHVPGADLPGVFTLRSTEDLDAIEASALPGRRAVVLGGGNVGLQTCEALLERGLSVTVVFRSPHLLSQMVDAEAGRRMAALFAAHKVALRPGRDVAEIVSDGTLTAVRLDDGELVPADLVVVGKGITPNVEWLAGSGIQVRRGVVVDLCGRTGVPAVFAAGDCTETIDPVSGAAAVSGIWPVAYEMGRAAGSAAVGVERPSAGALRLNASRFFGQTIVSIGEVREDRLPQARAEVLEERADVYRKLVYRGDRLVGALLYGDISQAGQFYRLYRDAASTSE
jgi:NAD(P)H-nitrite reductase large subunit/Fe-S-cluster-containing hydrogenase component 2